MQKHVLAALMLLTCTTNAGYRECATFWYNAPNGGGKVNYKLDCHEGCEGNWIDYKGVGTALGGGRQWTYVYVRPGAQLYFMDERYDGSIYNFRWFKASYHPYPREDGTAFLTPGMVKWYPRLKDVRCFYKEQEYEFVHVATVYEHHKHQNNGGKKRAIYNECLKNSNDNCTQRHELENRQHIWTSSGTSSRWWWLDNASSIKVNSGWTCLVRGTRGVCGTVQEKVKGYTWWNFSTGPYGDRLNDNLCGIHCYNMFGLGRRLEARGVQQSRRGLEARGDQQSRRGLQDGQQALDFTDPEAHWPEEASHHDFADVFGQGAGDVPPRDDVVSDDGTAVVFKDAKHVGGDLTGAQADMVMTVDDKMPTVIELTFSDDWTGERQWTVDGVEVREKKPVQGEQTEQEDPTVDSEASSALRRLETLEAGQ